MGNPFVSIVVPACNEGETIGACLGSLARQNYPKQAYEETPRRPRRRPHPPRFRKSRLEQDKIEMILSKEKRKIFKELLLNSNGHPDCSQTLL